MTQNKRLLEWKVADMEYGRTRIIKKFSLEFNGFSLNIGSKETDFGSINVDIDPNSLPDVLADVCYSPFKSDIFDVIYFNDVIGYIPKNNEILAIKEINRMLKKGGVLIFSAPNDRMIFTMLDLERYIMTYNHHRTEYIENLIRSCDFDIEEIFTTGSYWTCVAYLWYCLITFPTKKFFGISIPYAPSLLIKLSDKEYNKKCDNGYTIFCVGRRTK